MQHKVNDPGRRLIVCNIFLRNSTTLRPHSIERDQGDRADRHRHQTPRSLLWLKTPRSLLWLSETRLEIATSN
ncbi:hypothetical protein CKA32_003257 [Geitlerinema sp. FC II]|nr:hypothetical protein CKA32_003257 [Geitlerinema sp. FC II]